MDGVVENKQIDYSPTGALQKGLRITALLLLIICGIELIGWNVMVGLAAVKLNRSYLDMAIYSSSIFGSLTPLMGVIAGIGLILMRPWGVTMTAAFAVASLLLYGIVFGIIVWTDPAWRFAPHVFAFPVLIFLGLPSWALFYIVKMRNKLRPLFRSASEPVSAE